MTGAPRLADAWVRGASLVGLLAIWQLAATFADPTLLPGPAVVLFRVWRGIVAGELLYHLAMTLARVAVSFLVAMAVGTAVGILMGRFRWVDASLDGALILGLNIPALVTTILCYIWLGLGEVAAVTAVALNKIPTVAVTLREGARAVDRELLDVAAVFRVPPARVFTRIYLPQLYPYLMVAARSGLALVWKIVLVVELLGRSSGVGFQLGAFFQFFDLTSILAYTLAFACAIVLIEMLALRPLERRLTRWRR
jgi:ABC-type nitrate/sulfonate/bicarbonate transport system permease component